MRSGGGPEVSRVTFEFSFDGSFYSLLGNRHARGRRVGVDGLNLPLTAEVFIRARGYYETGYQNGSGSIVESILILRPRRSNGDFDGDGKADITVYRPSTGTWSISAVGHLTRPFVDYQWGWIPPCP